MLYVALWWPNGLNPSEAKPSLIFLGSASNSCVYHWSFSTHYHEMDGSLHSDLYSWFLECHSTSSLVSASWNNLCNLGVIGNVSEHYEESSSQHRHLFILMICISGIHLSWHNPSGTEHNYSYKHGPYHIQFQLHEENSSFFCRCVAAQMHLGKICEKQPTSHQMICWSSAQMSSPEERWP